MPCRGGYDPPVRLCNRRLRGARRLGAPSAGATCGRPLIEDAPLAERAAFLEVASLDFYRKRPRRLRLGRGTAFFPKESGGKERAGGCPPWPPQKRGLMAAVGCTDRAKIGRALPPALLAVTSRALPRLGRHASGLPCKPWEWLRCTHLARRAAVGALPLKYYGARGSWKRRVKDAAPYIVGPSYGSFASGQARKLIPSAGPPLPTATTPLGRRGGPNFYARPEPRGRYSVSPPAGQARPYFSRLRITWATLTPEAPAWARPRVMPAPSPAAKKPGRAVSSSLDRASRAE